MGVFQYQDVVPPLKQVKVKLQQPENREIKPRAISKPGVFLVRKEVHQGLDHSNFHIVDGVCVEVVTQNVTYPPFPDKSHI